MHIPLTKPEQRIDHSLIPLYDELKAFRSRRQFEQSALYGEHGTEINRAVNGIEWRNCRDEQPKKTLRVVAWNIERGIRLPGIIHYLKTDPVLTETDIGMGRSGNQNVPLEIANSLDLNYCYANSFLVLAKGDLGEQEHRLENTLSLHGTTILSRYRIESYRTVELPTKVDFFTSSEKRIGRRRALICKIRIGDREYDFTAMHLELATPLKGRGAQVDAVLRALAESQADSQLIGGDLNTSTYNLSSKWGLARNLIYKALFVGFSGAIAHYMVPDQLFEKPIFEQFRNHGFDYNSFNDKSAGTLYYDINDPILTAKVRNFISEIGIRFLRKKLEPWDGRVPLRLDWFAGKGFEAVREQNGVYAAPQVVEGTMWDNRPISDHDPIVVDLWVNKDAS